MNHGAEIGNVRVSMRRSTAHRRRLATLAAAALLCGGVVQGQEPPPPADPPPLTEPAPVAPPPADEPSPAEPSPAEPPPLTPPVAEPPGEPAPAPAVAPGEAPAAQEPVLLPTTPLPEPPASPAEPVRLYRDACLVRAPEEEARLEAAQRMLFETVCRANRWVDGLFGYEDPEAAARVTGRAELGGLYSDYEGVEPRTRFHARWQFPNLDRRINAFIGREEEDEFVQDRSEALVMRSSFFDLESEEDWLAGLGYSLPGSGRRRTDLQVGAKLSTAPKIFAQARVRWVFFPSERSAWRLRETVFYQNRDGFGVTSTIDRDRVLTPKLLLRWGARATFSEATEGAEWRSAAVLYQNLPGDHAMAWELFATGESADEVPLHEYGARILLRQPFFAEGVHGVWVLGYSYPRREFDERREGSGSIGFSLEIAFGRWLALR
jgi:hypothetical protein